MDNTENKQLTPLEAAEGIFTECAIMASKQETPELKKEKLEAAQKAAIEYLDYQVDYWLQIRAEFQNILRLSSQKP